MDTFLCKPEVFWVGVQTLTAMAALAIAILGLIGLIFYTIYTRNMMKISEKAWQLNMLPSLVVQTDLSESGVREVSIMNIGVGPALNLRFWAQQVTPHFDLNGDVLVRKPEVQETFLGPLLSQRTLQIKDNYFSEQARLLYVVEADDLAGGSQQMQLLAESRTGERHALQVRKLSTDLPVNWDASFLQKILWLFRRSPKETRRT
jgi:hypothetical protein